MDGELVGIVVGGLVVGTMLGLIFGIFVMVPTVEARWEGDAVEAGHAEYYLDKDNERQWRWLPPCERMDGTVEGP